MTSASQPSRFEAVIAALAGSLAESSVPTVDDFGAFLSRFDLDPKDRAAIEALGPKRFFLYRTLVRGNFRAAIRNEMGETAALLGPRFDEEIAAFLDRGMPLSHYMLDAAFEFLEAVRARWAADPTLPPWTVDLARHELLAYEVSAARDPDPAPRFLPALAIDRALVFDTAARLDTYAYPVHLLADDPQRTLEPKATWLLVYRDEAYDIRHLELTELAAAATRAWLGGATLKEGLERAATETSRALPLEDAAKFLADLAERKILLGAAV
ncbi:MAG: hypothetical protein U0414_41885 [Polyangiaceae bacterium]